MGSSHLSMLPFEPLSTRDLLLFTFYPLPFTFRSVRVHNVIEAIVAAGGEASRDQIGERLGLTSTRSSMIWINRALEAGFVEPTTDSPFDPGRKYRLSGRGMHITEDKSPRTNG